LDPAVVALITAAAAVVGGAITKTFDTWLGTRSRVSEELRERRVEVYQPIWQRTRTLSQWPRTDATVADVEHLHRDLRRWYYDVGGIYLSENARTRYGDVQELLARYLNAYTGDESKRIAGPAYTDLMGACSALRTALTEDLESRRQRSLLWSLGRRRVHWKHARNAEKRKAVAPELKEHRVRVRLDAVEAEFPEAAAGRVPPPGSGPEPD
jgi:hypothetical protein